MDAVDPTTTYGAMLLGSFFAFGLSGAISLQCISYFKMYPHDGTLTKTLVSTVWVLDLSHSSLICASLLTYFITFHEQRGKIDYIPWTLALTVLCTATQTFIVHCFFAQKILKASGRNWRITTPILFLASGRLFAATVSTFEMIRLHQFSDFVKPYPGWVFTTGLSLSSGVDLLIMGWLCYYLMTIRTRIAPDSTVMVRWVNLITLYTLENGALTFFSTTASLICWVVMRYNLVFLGLHFVIGKLYANSLLASINVRQELQNLQWRSENTPNTRPPNRLNPTQSINSDSFQISTGSCEMDNLTSVPKPPTIRVSSQVAGRPGRIPLRGYYPSVPTIPERGAESLIA